MREVGLGFSALRRYIDDKHRLLLFTNLDSDASGTINRAEFQDLCHLLASR